MKKQLRGIARRTVTYGTQRVMNSLADRGLRGVSFAIPLAIHNATDAAIERMNAENSGNLADTQVTKQYLYTVACDIFHGFRAGLELPLVNLAPFDPEVDKRFTWYPREDIYKAVKMLAVERGSSMRQIVLSALVQYCKDMPEFRRLNLEIDNVPSPRGRVPYPEEDEGISAASLGETEDATSKKK